MVSHDSFSKRVEGLSVDDRITRAKDCVWKLTDKAVEIVDLHANTSLVSLSKNISSRITNGKARQAYMVLRDSLLRYEIIKLVAIWDKPEDNVVSIPTAIALIKDDRVIDELAQAVFAAHSERAGSFLNTSSDPEIQSAIEKIEIESQSRYANDQAAKARAVLSERISVSAEIADREMKRVRNLRNYLGHSLSKTREEEKSGPIPAPTAAEIVDLKTQSIALIQDLYCWVNLISFDIVGECGRQADEHADAFWSSFASK